MNKIFLTLAVTSLLAACGQGTETAEPAAPAAPLKSGVELTGMDTSVRPQDDYYAYANGKWLEETEIPADQFGWGSYMTLRDDSLTDVRAIVDEVAGDAADSEAAAKIGNYYNAYLDEERVEELGMSPLKPFLAEIDAIEDHAAMSRWFGDNNDIGVDGPFNLYINQDDKDSTKYVMFLVQSGLGLPDKEYYFDDSERGLQLRDAYVAYSEKLLAASGYADAAEAAKRIMALETDLAEHHWDKEDSRDADKVYNKTTDAELGELAFRLDRSLGEMAAHGARRVLGFRLADAELHGAIAVLVLGPLGDDLAFVHLQDRDGNILATFHIDPGHSQLLCDHT